MTNTHFKTDDVSGGYKMSSANSRSHGIADRAHRPDKDRHGERKHRPKPAGGGDEDDEIRKAIEMSKITA